MDSKQFILKNKPLPKATEPIIEKMTASGQHILFVIVGDLSLKGKYSETALIFTETDVTTFDVSVGEAKTIPYSDMKEVQSKRMYGNATLSAIMPNGKREIFFRYTYAVAALLFGVLLAKPVGAVRDVDLGQTQLGRLLKMPIIAAGNKFCLLLKAHFARRD